MSWNLPHWREGEDRQERKWCGRWEEGRRQRRGWRPRLTCLPRLPSTSFLGQEGPGPAGHRSRDPTVLQLVSKRGRGVHKCSVHQMWVSQHVGNYCPVSAVLLLKNRGPHLITVMRVTGVPRKECQQCPQMCKGSVGTV